MEAFELGLVCESGGGGGSVQHAATLAESMAGTIVSGTRALDSTSGVRELSANSKTKSVFVTVPEGYVVTAQRGPDFIVHHIHKVTVFGDEEATLGIYLGDHPSPNREGFSDQGMGNLFGKRVPWYQKVTDEKAVGRSWLGR